MRTPSWYVLPPCESHVNYMLHAVGCHYVSQCNSNWALSRISPRVRVRVSVSIVLGLASGGYSWIWPVTVV